MADCKIGADLPGHPTPCWLFCRKIGKKRWGRSAYESKFLPKVGPLALYGLLFTIVILFALQGKQITSQPLDVARIALPLLAYFAIMWALGIAVGQFLNMDRTTTLAFTAAGNNFELAIAVAIATFDASSGQVLAGVVGPLIEVPVLVGLVYVSLWLRKKLSWPGNPKREDGRTVGLQELAVSHSNCGWLAHVSHLLLFIRQCSASRRISTASLAR